MTEPRMTCQCCGRGILAKTGTIAHHGYQRPGSGWQTSSCMGAKHLPFEVSRDRLGDMIKLIRRDLTQARRDLKNVVHEMEELSATFEDTRKEAVWNPRRYRKTHPETTVKFSRSTFEAVRAENAPHAAYRSFPSRYDDVKDLRTRQLQGRIKNLTEWVETCQARYDSWKPTHKREGDHWAAL